MTVEINIHVMITVKNTKCSTNELTKGGGQPPPIQIPQEQPPTKPTTQERGGEVRRQLATQQTVNTKTESIKNVQGLTDNP